MRIYDIDIVYDSATRKIRLTKGDARQAATVKDKPDEDWCKSLSNAVMKLGWIDSSAMDNFAKAVYSMLKAEKIIIEQPTLLEKLSSVEEEKPAISSLTTAPPVKQEIDLRNTLISMVGENRQNIINMLNQISAKQAGDVNTLYKHYIETASRLKLDPSLLIYRDWQRVGGEAIRRVVLMNENMETFTFNMSAEYKYSVNTCLKLITNIPIPFDKGKIIGISNRTLSLFFTDTIEKTNGSVTRKPVLSVPRIDGVEKIPETDDIYQKILRAEAVLAPIDQKHSIQTVINLCKQHNAAMEEVIVGSIRDIYPTKGPGLRQAIHVGDPETNPARVTAWVESDRYNLTENDIDRQSIVRIYGFMQYQSSSYQGVMQDNLQINVYHLIVDA